jgi:hypothetical protein
MRRAFGFVAAAAALASAAPAGAIQRSFVASSGLDTNPCTLQLPCRGFAAAIALTDANGELIVLDSAGYGPVTVTKSASIVAPAGVYAGISVFAGQDGVTVNAGATDKVVLRGLAINGQDGNRGIVVAAGGQVHVENCVVSNMGGDGVQVNGGTAVYIAGSALRSNTGNGIHVAAGTAEVHVDDTRVSNNVFRGIFVEAGTLSVNRSSVENNQFSGLEVNPAASSTVTAAVRDSQFSGNGISGVFAVSGAAGRIVRVSVERSGSVRNGASGFTANSGSVGTVSLVVSDSTANENGGNGVFAKGLGAMAAIARSTFSRNGGPGVVQANNAELRTHGNNAAPGNVGSIETSGTITGVGQI